MFLSPDVLHSDQGVARDRGVQGCVPSLLSVMLVGNRSQISALKLTYFMHLA